MKRPRGINGITQASVGGNAATVEQLSATMDYAAMMVDVDIPIEDTEGIEVSGISEGNAE